MQLWEIKAEIAAASAEETELVLLETGCEGWSLLEDAIARRAWVVGIFENEFEASSRWTELKASLPS